MTAFPPPIRIGLGGSRPSVASPPPVRVDTRTGCLRDCAYCDTPGRYPGTPRDVPLELVERSLDAHFVSPVRTDRSGERSSTSDARAEDRERGRLARAAEGDLRLGAGGNGLDAGSEGLGAGGSGPSRRRTAALPVSAVAGASDGTGTQMLLLTADNFFAHEERALEILRLLARRETPFIAKTTLAFARRTASVMALSANGLCRNLLVVMRMRRRPLGVGGFARELLLRLLRARIRVTPVYLVGFSGDDETTLARIGDFLQGLPCVDLEIAVIDARPYQRVCPTAPSPEFVAAFERLRRRLDEGRGERFLAMKDFLAKESDAARRRSGAAPTGP